MTKQQNIEVYSCQGRKQFIICLRYFWKRKCNLLYFYSICM